MSGRLFTDYFLTDGIRATAEWKSSVEDAEAFAAFKDGLHQRYEALSLSENANEAFTEQELIRPVLELLGWVDYLPQQGTAGNEDIPDHLLFADSDSKQRASAERNTVDRFRNAAAVEESKRFGLSLDERDKEDKVRTGTPHGQIRRYLSTADIESEGRIRWGILTNGRVWRLYDHRARPRATGYFEVDLEKLLKSDTVDDLRVFHLLFQRNAFTLSDGATTTFLEAALAEGKRYEEKVTQDLSGVVFERVFPALVEALADKSGESLTDCRNAALVLLYRLLFVLYAEDRGLLPVSDSRYDDYGLRKRVRYDIANRMKDGDTFSAIATNYYDRLVNLFRIIDNGDPSIGLPAYNGGLFAPAATPILERARLSDAEIAPIIYGLSHVMDPQGEYQFVNYRDMSVQQLGSIYERLLEREPVLEEDGKVVIRPNPYARKDSGSFYTPQELVDLIVDRTLKPLVEERRKTFEDWAAALKSDRRPKAERRAQLKRLDPAVAVLELKLLDPAMGSGHFLVAAVDFLSDAVADLIESVPSVPDWLDGAYESPLVKRVESIRSDIIRRSRELNWVMDETQLNDQAIIRRMVLKRCIFGVDKNPLTVELAKVSLWLHSFTVGAPLSFLDHHLRCGDSLLGMRVSDGLKDLSQLGNLTTGTAIAQAEQSTKGMQKIETVTDIDVAEVHRSSALFGEVENATSDIRGLLDFLCGRRWFKAGIKKKDAAQFEEPLIKTLFQHKPIAYRLLARGPLQLDSGDHETGVGDWSKFCRFWQRTQTIAEGEGFVHWEVAFPGVWHDWERSQPNGGFDAVIGNPPWDRIKLQEVEWFSNRDRVLARAPTAAARRAGIRRLRDQNSSLTDEFDAAKDRSDRLSRMVRTYGDYPLLSGGDVNLYSLFVERAMSLIKPDGIVGLLTPSGIYADKTAARFFKAVSTSGRVGGVFDFENRKIFFKDVHASFKFCALIFGGEKRQFDETECAFFLNDTESIGDLDRCFPLKPADFARVNPNTGTAPVFRTRRDADITRRFYERNAVLVDRSKGKERRVWPIRYSTLFHMANDSQLFRTISQLEDDGFYPVRGNRWKRGDEMFVPLYEGKMVQAFDHRAASVTNREGNLFRPGQPDRTGEEEYLDAGFSPRPRYWVSQSDSEVVRQARWFLAFKDITASTNVRTMIAAAVPQVGCGHTLPVILPSDDRFSAEDSACLLANLNSFGLDYIARQKVQATHLTWFIVEQLPVIAPGDYDRNFGSTSVRDLVRDHVLRLSFTAHDMAPFARDLGYDGEPFAWDEEERRHLRTRLDAVYFHLYGLSRDDAGYILNTFPIVQRVDEKAFGRYRTREMILAYMNALAAGDTETDVDV